MYYWCRTNNTCLLEAARAQEVTTQDQKEVLVKAIKVTVVYDFAFNSILPFLVNFGILSPNRVISANYDFRRFFFPVFICFVAVRGRSNYYQ